MKKNIPRVVALLCTFMIGLLVASVFYRKNKCEVDPVVLVPTGLQSQSLDPIRLSLCDLDANVLAYRGKEIVVEASHISRLSSRQFSVLVQCGPRVVSAKITLANETNLAESLLVQMSELMYRRRESIDEAADKVILTGVDGRDAGGQDFDLVASNLEVVLAPADSEASKP